MPRPAATAALAAVLMAAAAWAAGQGPARFGEWVVRCPPGDSGFCSANAFLHRDDGPGLLEWRLRVAVPGFFAEPVVSLVAVRHAVAPDAEIVVQVDGTEPLRFAPVTGWQAGVAPNDHHLVDEAAASRLLAAMRGGRRLVFGYRDAGGVERAGEIPLEGYARALDYVGALRARRLPAFAADTARTWARQWRALEPAMLACLRRAPAQPAVVVEALREEPERVTARVLADGGGRFDCTFETESATVLRFTPAARWPPETTAAPWYLPGRRPPPEDACAGRLRLVDRADRPAGWLLYGCTPPA